MSWCLVPSPAPTAATGLCHPAGPTPPPPGSPGSAHRGAALQMPQNTCWTHGPCSGGTGGSVARPEWMMPAPPRGGPALRLDGAPWTLSCEGHSLCPGSMLSSRRRGGTGSPGAAYGGSRGLWSWHPDLGPRDLGGPQGSAGAGSHKAPVPGPRLQRGFAAASVDPRPLAGNALQALESPGPVLGEGGVPSPQREPHTQGRSQGRARRQGGWSRADRRPGDPQGPAQRQQGARPGTDVRGGSPAGPGPRGRPGLGTQLLIAGCL